MSSSRILLLDTASLYFRAFYGMPDTLRAENGMPVNAIRGLLDFIARLTDTYRPSHLVCCWDNDWRPAWRVELIPSYKAHRVAGAGDSVVAEMSSSASTAGEQAPDALAAQVPYIVEVLKALGIAIVGKDGYEADDVIATLAEMAATGADPMPADIVTGDRDLFQLVDDARRVRVLYVARGVGRHEQVDDGWVRDKYGVRPQAYVDYATLRGDASDGLPGVSGIGEKTAASLLTTYGSLEQVLAAASRADSPVSASIRSKLGKAIDYLAVAPTVVSVARDLDLGVTMDDLRRPLAPAHEERFAELAGLLSLGTSAERIRAALAAD